MATDLADNETVLYRHRRSAIQMGLWQTAVFLLAALAAQVARSYWGIASASPLGLGFWTLTLFCLLPAAIGAAIAWRARQSGGSYWLILTDQHLQWGSPGLVSGTPNQHELALENISAFYGVNPAKRTEAPKWAVQTHDGAMHRILSQSIGRKRDRSIPAFVHALQQARPEVQLKLVNFQSIPRYLQQAGDWQTTTDG
jgi:hypothetical protein